MQKVIFFLLLLVGVLGISASYHGPRGCGPHAQYVECGTACPSRCGDSDEPKICTMQCVSGCFCKSGYVLDNDQCISPLYCPELAEE